MANVNRINYIDAIKGFSILWVVLIHVDEGLLPNFIHVPYRLPLFFFISGFFFRPKPIKEFLTKRVNSLLIPLIGFVLISYLCQVFNVTVIERLFPSMDFSHMQNYNENLYSVRLLFSTDWYGSQNPFTPLNGPLWFLWAIFIVQFVYYGFQKLSPELWVSLLSVVIVKVAMEVIGLIGSDSGDFMFLKYSLSFYHFYVFGHLFCHHIIRYIANAKIKWIALVISFIGLFLVQVFVSNPLKFIPVSISTGFFILIVFIIFQEIYKFGRLRLFEYYGRNSLILLSVHILVFNFYGVLFPTILGDTSSFLKTPYYAIILFIVVLANVYLLTMFFNKYLPWLVNKKQIFKV